MDLSTRVVNNGLRILCKEMILTEILLMTYNVYRLSEKMCTFAHELVIF